MKNGARDTGHGARSTGHGTRAGSRGTDHRQLAGLETTFKALADQTRLRILALLVNGEICVCHIHESLNVPQPTASRHLAYLRRAGLVDTRKQGLWVYYRLAAPSDTLVRTVLGSATACVCHVPTVDDDRARLEACCASPNRRRR